MTREGSPSRAGGGCGSAQASEQRARRGTPAAEVPGARSGEDGHVEGARPAGHGDECQGFCKKKK